VKTKKRAKKTVVYKGPLKSICWNIPVGPGYYLRQEMGLGEGSRYRLILEEIPEGRALKAKA
jgi:hypothetical protein